MTSMTRGNKIESWDVCVRETEREKEKGGKKGINIS